MLMIVGSLWVVAGGWLALCLLLSWNALPKMPPAPAKRRRRAPLVSVCIPARNEERRIGRLLESLSRQTHDRYEVLVLDDESTDGTAERVRRFVSRTRRIRLLAGKPLPSGWVGKPWACHQLSRRARGRWVLFVDADVWLEPDALERTLLAVEGGADVYSPVPRLHAGGWLDVLAVPTLIYLLLSLLPMPWVLDPRSPLYRYLGTNGQYTIWRRRAYDSMGGHAAVAGEIVEDVKIGWLAARRGFKIAYGNGSDTVHCRMYGSARDVGEGFSKNIYPFLGARVVAAVAGLSALFFLFVAPFAVLVAGSGPLFAQAVFLCAAQWVVRVRQALQFRLSPLSAFLHPLGCLAFFVIGLNSMRWYLFRGHGTWRGRELRIGGKG